MVPWNLVLLWKKYGTMEKAMVLWTNLGYFEKKNNYVTILRAMELRFPNIKNIEDYKKLRSYGNIPKQLLLLLYNVKLWYMYYGKKTMVLWEKLWHDGKKYVTIYLYRKQWKFDILWKKLWYYTENYGNLIYYGKKTMVL